MALHRSSDKTPQPPTSPLSGSFSAEQQAEAIKVIKRMEIFNSWKHCTIDELIRIVVRRRFSYPMDMFHGSNHIIDRLYKIHGPELRRAHLARLEKFARETNVPHEQLTAQKALQCYLAVLNNDPARLRVTWERYHYPVVDLSTWHEFAEAAGDLPTKDQDIVAQLISVVETPFMFGPRYEAMVALGKIGPSSGRHAIEVIVKSIYDSSEHVTALRNRVIERISRPESDWIRCHRCNHGYVDGLVPAMPTVERCKNCLGLGFVPGSIVITQ